MLWGCPVLVWGRVQLEGAGRRCEARGSYCTLTLLPPAVVVTLWGWGLCTKPVGLGRAASRKVLGVSSLCWPQRSCSGSRSPSLLEDSSTWALMGLALPWLVLLGILPLQDAFLLSQSHPCAPWL